MKKGVLAVILVLGFLIKSQAQFEIGPKFGFNFSSLNGDLGFWHASQTNEFEMSGMQRIAFGIGTSFSIHDFIKISPELLMSYKGAEFEAPDPNVKLEYYLTYFEIPLLANIGVFDDPLSYYGIIGPSLGFLTGGTGQEYGAGAFEEKEEPIEDFFELSDNQEANKTDMGLILGAGASYVLGNGCVTGELRYGLGFTDINTDSEHYTYITAGKNRVFSIMFGYRLFLGGE